MEKELNITDSIRILFPYYYDFNQGLTDLNTYFTVKINSQYSDILLQDLKKTNYIVAVKEEGKQYDIFMTGFGHFKIYLIEDFSGIIIEKQKDE